MFRNKSVSTHKFAMTPRADIPRSSFKIEKAYKTTFDSGYLIPVYCDEVLPGDSFKVNMTAFARLSTPLFPIMDNLHLDSFFFYVPNRILWTNWEKFMGSQDNPADSISYVMPKVVSALGGFTVGSISDYFGLPTVGQVTAGQSVTVTSLWHRAYNRIWNEWFRDENLQNSVVDNISDGPDTLTDYALLKRGKRHDYFTSCLPWPQKGGTAVTIPLGTSAPIKSDGTTMAMRGSTGTMTNIFSPTGLANSAVQINTATTANVGFNWGAAGTSTTGLYADLTTATAATINQLRQSFQIQKLLERDARGGTRYKEIILSHFGVISPDARLDRPEYLGGGTTAITVNPVAQTSATGLTGGSTTVGSLSAIGTGVALGHGFRQSFTEHGVILGLVMVRADLTYQQGLRRMWSRDTRYDFYFPVFAQLGEQAVLQKEIYCTGVAAADNTVFGYQERWAEYRYNPSEITGLFRSTSAGTLDPWHLAQRFTAAPTLNSTFISETPPLQRVLAVGAAAAGKEFLFDAFFDVTAARPLPMYSVPGLIDHF